MTTTSDHSTARVSIWSVLIATSPIYFSLFSFLATVVIGYEIWYEIVFGYHYRLADVVHAIIHSIHIPGAASAIISLIVVENVRSGMVTAHYIDQYFKKKIKEREDHIRAEVTAEVTAEVKAEITAEITAEVTAAVIAEANARWRAWNDRRLAAEAAGELFDEPPPNLGKRDSDPHQKYD